MGLIRYSRSNELIGPEAVGITASAEDSEYPAENLCDLDPSNPAKLTTTTGNWVIEFSAATTIKAVGFVNHNLDSALSDVKIQGNATNDWASPSFSQTFTIPADEEDDFSIGPWIDVHETAPSYKWWRLYFGTANSVAIGIGELILCTDLHSLDHDLETGREDSEEMPDIVHTSGFGGKTTYSIGAKWKVWDGQVVIATNDDHWTLARHSRGRVRPWFFVPDYSENSCYLVVFDWSSARFAARRIGPTATNIPSFRICELSRGVPL